MVSLFDVWSVAKRHVNGITRGRKYLLGRILLVLSVCMLSANAISEVRVDSVDWSRAADGMITINGSGFGGGPRIELLDDFEHSGAATKTAVNLAGANTLYWLSQKWNFSSLINSVL